ncbi:unnamed protein product [Closterium sp. Yama58-4]|nr:unnamed protein product [Closterium sp. Yama58-4]
MSGKLPRRDSHCQAIVVLVALLFALSLAVSQTVAESAFNSQKRLIASDNSQHQQGQQQDGNATSVQVGPGIPIDPSRITRLSWEPRAFLYSGFLSHDECDHLINLARDKVTRSSVADNESGKSVLSEIRTSSGTFLNKYQDDIVKHIEERIAAWTFLPKEHGEAIQILKYEIGQKYEAHFDYFFDSVNTQMGGHRVATVLMYLTTVEAGGETVFPNAQPKPAMDATASDCANRGLAVKPQKGDALLFYSLHPDGTTDQSSLHASCPVIRGEKWSATKWIHPSVRMIDGAALLPAQVLRNLSDKLYDKRKAAALEVRVGGKRGERFLRNLSDKLYDKRKAAALEIKTPVNAAVAEEKDEENYFFFLPPSLLFIPNPPSPFAGLHFPHCAMCAAQIETAIETAVKAAVAEGNDERINAIISLLANDYATSAQPNQRKGGLIGLAAVTVGLGPDASHYLDRIVPEVLKSFSDSDSRVRYYACEALYNIAKVTRGDFIVFFNDVFNALCKLSADLDPNVQSAAHLLDRLVKVRSE